MLIDFLIIGQGISGTWLSYYLQKENKSFLVIDNTISNSPSRVSAGIINPVTGRRHVTVWMAEELLPFSWNVYNELGKELGISAISKKNIIDFFPSPQMRISFLERVNEQGPYVHSCSEENKYTPFFNFDFGAGKIKPVYTAQLENILPAWRQNLKKNDSLLEEDFDITQLKIENDKIHYKDIIAKKVIFCDGNSSSKNPFFRQLPFAPNKGEILIAEIPDLPADNIYKKGMMLVPMATKNLWWIGSNYAWEFDHTNPTNEFREKTEALLKSWLKLPFKITNHLAAVRPATLERRPFVGIHPQHPNVGILNGLGTKGCSLAPYFAKQLVNYLLYQQPILPEADINRFTKSLTRK